MAKKSKVGESSTIVAAFQELVGDTKLPADIAKDCLERAIAKAYATKNFEDDGVLARCSIDDANGTIDIYWIRTVVDKDEIDDLDASYDVSLKEAKLTNPDIKVGDQLETYVSFKSLGREVVQAIRSLFTQNIREAQKNLMYDACKEIEGSIQTGVVEKVEEGKYVTVLINNKISAYMSYRDCIPGEKYNKGDVIKVYVKEVSKDAKKPSLISVSRSDAKFLFKLFSKEIVEVENGDVYIRKIARLPGSRSKIAVSSKVEGLDAAGTCIGKSGSRIQKIVEQLNNGQEKIDVVQYYDDELMMLKSAISPANVIGIATSYGEYEVTRFNKEIKQKETITKEGKIATLVVSNETYSLAIGIKGQNAFLAQKLSSFDKLVIMSVDDAFGKVSYTRIEDIEKAYRENNNIAEKPVKKVILTKDEDEEYVEVVTPVTPVTTVETVETVKKEETKTEVKKEPKVYVSKDKSPKGEHISVVEETKKEEEVKEEVKDPSKPSKKALKKAAEEEAKAKLEEAKKNYQPIYTEEELKEIEEAENDEDDDSSSYDEDYDDLYDQY